MTSNSNNGGNWSAFALDLEDAHDIMCAIIVRSLRDAKWPVEEVQNMTGELVSMIADRLNNEDFLTCVAQDAAVMKSHGASDKQTTVMANAAFATLAVRLADSVIAKRVAQMN